MGRGRASSIERLPEQVFSELQALLRDKRVTQVEIVERVNRLLEAEGRAERISAPALNRYASRMEQVGAKLRQSREVAELWIAKLGSAPGGQTGHLVNEMVCSLAFETSLKLQEGELSGEELPETIDMLKGLALTLQRLEAASTMNVKREQAIRKQALEDAANAATQVAKKGGLSAETVQTLRREILGIAA